MLLNLFFHDNDMDFYAYNHILTNTVSCRYPLLCNSMTKVFVSLTSCRAAVKDMKHHVRWKGWFGKTFPPKLRQKYKT